MDEQFSLKQLKTLNGWIFVRSAHKNPTVHETIQAAVN